MTPTTRPATDGDLLAQAQRGDVAAFETLIRRHFGLVHAIAAARLRDPEIAEDLAQEVMLRVFLHLKQLPAGGNFPAWVARIARNLAIDWLRRGQRASRLLPMVPLDEARLATLAARGKGAREAMATQQENQALREAPHHFVAVDHFSGECVGLHASLQTNRFEALEPLRQGVRERFGAFEENIAEGLLLLHHHGSQYVSDDFQRELRFQGVMSSPSFVHANSPALTAHRRDTNHRGQHANSAMG